ncbi:hypothetical protein N9V27_00230 [bacterium]|nr:hypothetical protein [bacterium]
MSIDEPSSRIAFQVWYDFMKYVSPQTKKERSTDDFIRSPDYIGFVKFANYIIELRPNETNKFIKWLFKHSVKLSNWNKRETYSLYIQESSKTETVERAVERMVLLMKSWSEETGNSWEQYFQEVPTATAVNSIVMGRISPWIIYSSKSAQDLLDRMEPGQLETITRSIDTEWWTRKIQKSQTEVTWCNKILN